MNASEILDIFYNKFIKEAANGKVDCYFTTNIIFNLIVENEEVTKRNSSSYEGVLIPTLKITNKRLFDELLVKYVENAIEYYDESDFFFLNDIEQEQIENKEEYLIKYIISTLLANASISDFANPIQFLEERIEMFHNRLLEDDECLDFGYLESIDATLKVIEEKSPITTETPYRLKGELTFSNGHILTLPYVYAAKSNNTYKLYAIQNNKESKNKEESEYLKKIRKGLVAKIKGSPEHYFLSMMIFISICQDAEIELVPFLIERWNAKKISLLDKARRNPNLKKEDLEEMQNKLQTNITDIFIRYITKLQEVTDGIDLVSIPFEIDSNLHIKIDKETKSSAKLFEEILQKYREYNKNKAK